MAYRVKYQNVNYLSNEWVKNRGRHYKTVVFDECPISGSCHFLVQPNEDPFVVLGGDEFMVIGCQDDDEET